MRFHAEKIGHLILPASLLWLKIIDELGVEDTCQKSLIDMTEVIFLRLRISGKRRQKKEEIECNDIGGFQYNEANDYEPDHISLSSHVEEHRAEIGDEPDKPHGYAELVEIYNCSFIFLEQYHCSPNRVDEHKKDRDEPPHD